MRRFCELSEGGAFDELARRYCKPAAAIARRYLGAGSHLADDAVQETFLRVFRNRTRFDSSRTFAAWFYTILRNVCADFRRQGTRQSALLERFAQDPSFHAEQPRETPAEDDILLLINAADREVLIYRLVHGMTFEEIAMQLGCSLESAKKRAQRALQRLRQAADKDRSGSGVIHDAV
jgi:RNA polymerase sigma-70 factor (ECF subfamily)